MPSDMTAATAHELTVFLIPGTPLILSSFELASFELASFGLSSFEEASEPATDDGLLELRSGLTAIGEDLCGLPPVVGVAVAQQRGHELLHEVDLAVGAEADGAQVAHLEPVRE
jgi:hypothetical protein